MWVVEAAPADEPQMKAAARGTLDKVRRLCRLAPDAWLDRRYRSGQISGKDCLYLRIMLAHCADLSTPRGYRDTWTPLDLAVWKGLDDIVEWLLSCGANVDGLPSVLDGSGAKATTVPLCLAVFRSRASTAALLLANGASLSLEDGALPPRGGVLPTIVHLACVLGFAELVGLLMATGRVQADPTDLLHCSFRHSTTDNPAVTKLLIEYGADFDFAGAILGELLHSSKWQSMSELIRSERYRGKCLQTERAT